MGRSRGRDAAIADVSKNTNSHKHTLIQYQARDSNSLQIKFKDRAKPLFARASRTFSESQTP